MHFLFPPSQSYSPAHPYLLDLSILSTNYFKIVGLEKFYITFVQYLIWTYSHNIKFNRNVYGSFGDAK
jgi:hypothetical protein